MTRRDAVLAWLAGCAWAAALTLAVVAHHGSWTAPLHLAPPWAVAGDVPREVDLLPRGQGYDGQFFFRMAEAPFSTRPVEHGVRFDAPGLRASRIGFPLTAHLLAAVSPLSPAQALLALNVLAGGFVALGGALLATFFGRRWVEGLIVLALPAVTYGITMVLADVVALALALLALNAAVRGRDLAATALLTAAAFTRESVLLIVAALVAGWLIAWWREREAAFLRGALVSAVPLAVFAAWQLVVRSLTGEWGVLSSGDANFGWPFATFVTHAGLLVPRDGFSVLRLVCLGLVATVVGCAAAALASGRPLRPTSAPFAAGLTTLLFAGSMLFVSLGRVQLYHYRNFSRAATELLVGAIVVSLARADRWSRLARWALLGGGVVLAAWSVRAATPVAART